MSVLAEVTKSDDLVSLIQKENYVGRVYSINYENALVLTNDRFKRNVNGIPQNSFLIATTLDPETYATSDPFDQEIILLRVMGVCKLPQDDDNIRTKLDQIQNKTSSSDLSDTSEKPDILTQSILQLGGLECRVLGTFYMKNQELQLGSDIENFSSSLTQYVYLPKGDALKIIVNYVDPIRKKKAEEDFRNMGIEKPIEPFEIGSVRYTSSDRLHRNNEEEKVPVSIQPADFLARRTAVLGMTRTGKSNMVKQTVSVVKKVSNDVDLKIGQLIFDINGEYANANGQDKGAISEIFKDDCIRYRMVPTPGFKILLTNFYEQLEDGFQILSEKVREEKKSVAQDIMTFLDGISFDIPEESNKKNRYKVMIALYKCLLYAANFEISGQEKVYFEANSQVCAIAGASVPTNGFSIPEAYEWFYNLREKAEDKANAENQEKKQGEAKKLWYHMLPSSTKGNYWLDDVSIAMLNMIVQKNNSNNSMFGYKCLLSSREYHTPERRNPVVNEIYNNLKDGKIVILDLSVGNANMREKISKDLAKYIFNSSMEIFIRGEKNRPPFIMIYVEEAHNLIGQKAPLTDPWPRLAKEGAKYNIGLIYATQEVSSVHPNILSNTENWFVTHLNSENEIRELDKFYDFADFHKSLLRAQDVGFARVKTLSSSFVVPVQINKFEPEKWRQ